MKVKCIKIYNEHRERFEEKSYWLTIGKEYVVLAIEIHKNKTSYLIASDHNQQPVLANSIQFEIINGKISNNWYMQENTLLSRFFIEPKAWSEPGFWDDCYNRDPKAMEIYKREAKKIYEEEGIDFHNKI